jgi:hypothetical protein
MAAMDAHYVNYILPQFITNLVKLLFAELFEVLR